MKMKAIKIENFITNYIRTSTDIDYPLYLVKGGKNLPISVKNEMVVPPEMIGIYYKTINCNQYGNNGWRYFGKLFHEVIVLDRTALNSLGLLKAEMSQGEKNTGKIQFTNNEPLIINSIINWFERFGIKENDWKWRIIFNEKLKSNETEKETKARELAAKRFWFRETRLQETCLQNKHIHYQKSFPGNLRIRNKWGTVAIESGNVLFRHVIICLINKIFYSLLSLDKKSIHWFLDGFFSGEGCVNRRRLIVPVKNDIDRELIKSSILKIGIILNKDWDTRGAKSLVMGGIKNMFLVYRFGICNSHPHKRLLMLKNLIDIKRFQKNAKLFKKKILGSKLNIENEYQQIKSFVNLRKNRFENDFKNFLH